MPDEAADVSVVIPMYNAERFIGEALESVRSQTIRPREIIVVDDGSTDRSVAVVEAWDPEIRVLTQANAGAASARQAGSALAKGEMLAFLDADDLWLPDALEVRLAVLEAHPDVHAVYGGVQQFMCETAPEAVKQSMNIHTDIETARHPGCMLIRTPAFRAMGGFNPDFREGEMLEFVSRFESAGFVSHMMPNLIFRRRVHGANTVLNAKSLNKAYLAALRERLRQKG